MQPKDRRLVTEQALEEGMASFDTRIESIETMAGLAPGQVTDAQTANLVTQSSTQTRTALNQVVNTHLSPVERTANTANLIATTTAGRVDALEVLTDVTPGNVDDATIGLHVSQAGSLAREAVERTILDIPANLFDPTKITPGMIYSQGAAEPTPHSSWTISDWIPVAPNAEYTYGGREGASILRVTYFDVNRQYISDFSFPAELPYTHTTPENAAWARISVSPVNTPVAQMNRGPALLPYDQGGTGKIREEYVPEQREIPDGEISPEKTTFFEVSPNLFVQDTVTRNHRMPSSNSGEAQPVDGFHVSDWIPIIPGETYSYTDVYRITYFDGSQEFRSRFDPGYDHRAHQAPTGSEFVRLTVADSLMQTAQMTEGEHQHQYQPGGVVQIKKEYIPLGLGLETTDPELIIVDTEGLGETYDAPIIEAQPDLYFTTTADVYGWYDDLVTAHPDYVTRLDLGPSSDNTHRVYAYSFRPKTVPDESFEVPLPVALIVTGIHGMEKAAVHHTWRLAKALCEEWQDSPTLEAMRWNVEILIVPVTSPYGYDNAIRHNANGVDLNRNFESSWSLGTEGDNTYGGPAPLSEPEAIAVNSLMQAVQDRAVLGVDFHNFGTSEDNPHQMIWVTHSRMGRFGQFGLALGKRLISRMSRKWRREHPWVTLDAPYFGYSDLTTAGGTTKEQFGSHGFPGATFEISLRQLLDEGDGDNWTSRAMTLGYEAFVNYMAMGIKAGIELKNRN